MVTLEKVKPIQYDPKPIAQVKRAEGQQEVITATVFKYNSEVSQTDDTPLYTANGEKVHVGSLGCPSRYPFGTKVIIDGIEYRCNDRMAERYRNGNFFDIWAETYQEAIQFGKQTKEVTIIFQ